VCQYLSQLDWVLVSHGRRHKSVLRGCERKATLKRHACKRDSLLKRFWLVYGSLNRRKNILTRQPYLTRWLKQSRVDLAGNRLVLYSRSWANCQDIINFKFVCQFYLPFKTTCIFIRVNSSFYQVTLFEWEKCNFKNSYIADQPWYCWQINDSTICLVGTTIWPAFTFNRVPASSKLTASSTVIRRTMSGPRHLIVTLSLTAPASYPRPN
jgi:hypothetical protein